MANNTIVLEGELRTEFGKGPARRMRVAKEIRPPCTRVASSRST